MSMNISFQLMTRAEPPQMVQKTIEALLAIKAAGDEILIVDNNHNDKTLYEPLQAYCESLDDSLKVHFYHEDFIAGYKAGALNFALARMDVACDYIVVVDSDYQALPWARASIAAAIKTYPEHALLQFPQYYRDADKPDIHTELNHYFSKHLRAQNNLRHSLSTGTFAVIKKQTLQRVGGWSGGSITEDAQMGVLLHLKGERTRYVPDIVATGMLPNTLSDLISQRRRWIYGNAQVLVAYPKLLLKNLSVRDNTMESFQDCSQKDDHKKASKSLVARLFSLSDAYKIRAHLSQLSAWINLTGIFIVLHMICLAIVFSTTLINSDLFDSARVVASDGMLSSALSILTFCYLSYGIFMGRRLYAYLKDSKPLLTPYSTQLNKRTKSYNSVAKGWNTNVQNNKVTLKTRIKAWLVHMSFWELGALSWLPVLWGQKKPFICTPKFAVLSDDRNSSLADFMALPKLLIILNALTALLIFSYSKILFAAALVVLLIKLVSHWTVVKNFNANRQDNVSAEAVDPFQANSKMPFKDEGIAATDNVFSSNSTEATLSETLNFKHLIIDYFDFLSDPDFLTDADDLGDALEDVLDNDALDSDALDNVAVWGRYDNVYDRAHYQEKHQENYQEEHQDEAQAKYKDSYQGNNRSRRQSTYPEDNSFVSM